MASGVGGVGVGPVRLTSVRAVAVGACSAGVSVGIGLMFWGCAGVVSALVQACIRSMGKTSEERMVSTRGMGDHSPGVVLEWAWAEAGWEACPTLRGRLGSLPHQIEDCPT
jgi:hypothetical protein